MTKEDYKDELENKYIKSIRELFEENVSKKDNSEWQPRYLGKNYYNRWFCTSEIAKKIDEKIDKIRRELRKLEKNGYIKSKCSSNYINWSLTKYEGFKDHIFGYYVERE